MEYGSNIWGRAVVVFGLNTVWIKPKQPVKDGIILNFVNKTLCNYKEKIKKQDGPSSGVKLDLK